MQGNQPIVDDYHRLLLTHSLCLPMAQDLQSWIKLANLCHNSNTYQSQTSDHSDLQTTLVFSLVSQRTFYCPSLIDQQLNNENNLQNNSNDNISTSLTEENIQNTNIKLEQNHQEQLKLIENMKEMVLKACLPALDNLRK
ncbi:unnamed protein product [Rotaria sp. Silwood1]|nr:unnamed protein product [Rotaria sp. Silwood1]CAF1674110.1 unnamed protein product [Rotaria sp. Silwood1]